MSAFDPHFRVKWKKNYDGAIEMVPTTSHEPDTLSIHEVYLGWTPLREATCVVFTGNFPYFDFPYLMGRYERCFVTGNVLLETVFITPYNDLDPSSTRQDGGVLCITNCKNLQSITIYRKATLRVSHCDQLSAINAVDCTVEASMCYNLLYIKCDIGTAVECPALLRPAMTNRAQAIQPAKIGYNPDFRVKYGGWSAYLDMGGRTIFSAAPSSHIDGEIQTMTLDQLSKGWDGMTKYQYISLEGDIPIGSISLFVSEFRTVYILGNRLLRNVNDTFSHFVALHVRDCSYLQSLIVRGNVDIYIEDCNALEAIETIGCVDAKRCARLRAIHSATRVIVEQCPLLRELPDLPGPERRITIRAGCPLVPKPVEVLSSDIVFWPEGAGQSTQDTLSTALMRRYTNHSNIGPETPAVSDLSYVYAGDVGVNPKLLVVGSEEDWEKHWRVRRSSEPIAETQLAIKSARRARVTHLPPEIWIIIYHFLRARM